MVLLKAQNDYRNIEIKLKDKGKHNFIRFSLKLKIHNNNDSLVCDGYFKKKPKYKVVSKMLDLFRPITIQDFYFQHPNGKKIKDLRYYSLNDKAKEETLKFIERYGINKDFVNYAFTIKDHETINDHEWIQKLRKI